MALKCVLCGMAHLPNEVCGRDTEGGVARAFGAAQAPSSPQPVETARLERARAVLSEASAKAGLAPTLAAPIPPQAALPAKFDRVAYQRAYMRTYRARKKQRPT